MRIGDHEFGFEPPDLVIMRYRGTLAAPDFTRGMEWLHGHCGDWPHMVLLVDVSELTTIPPDTRKIVPEATSWMPMRGISFYGAGFAVRTVSMMLVKVINLVRGTDNPPHYSNDETAARSWLDERRAELAREEGRPA